MIDPKQLLAAAKAIQADVVALGMGKPAGHGPERLRPLEAVAEACMANALERRGDMGYGDMTLAECVALVPVGHTWRAALESLAALEALDEKELL